LAEILTSSPVAAPAIASRDFESKSILATGVATVRAITSELATADNVAVGTDS
jgi:hypothetical protein